MRFNQAMRRRKKRLSLILAKKARRWYRISWDLSYWEITNLFEVFLLGILLICRFCC